MSSVHSKQLNVYTAKQFKESFSATTPSNVYLTIGKTSAWSNEANPPVYLTSDSVFYDVWNNMIGAKKITGNNIRHAIPRFNWTANTVYYQYNHLIDSSDLMDGVNQFYVITDEYNVYKCISNNYGANSTSKPTSISTTSDFHTEDGYIWKYMYSVSAEEQLRYLTDEYIPVKTLTRNDGTLQWTVQNNAIDGAIHHILVDVSGNNYTANDITITITGDGQNANAYAVRNTISNTIQSIIVDDKGEGYSYANVTISSNTGANATATAIISPRGGHGSDPLNELGGSNLIINMQLKSTESGKLPISNKYRQLALIDSPYIYGTSNTISNSVVRQTTTVVLTGTSVDYALNEFVYQGTLGDPTFSGTVVDWDSANNKLYLSNVKGTPTANQVVGQTSTAARQLGSVIPPEMQKYTGTLLYLNNIVPIERATDQTEDFSIVLSF